MRDAVYKTVSGAFRELAGRKAIILLTDGKDVDSRIGSAELLHRVEESDTLIYTLMFKTQERVRRPTRMRAPNRHPRGPQPSKFAPRRSARSNCSRAA